LASVARSTPILCRPRGWKNRLALANSTTTKSSRSLAAIPESWWNRKGRLQSPTKAGIPIYPSDSGIRPHFKSERLTLLVRDLSPVGILKLYDAGHVVTVVPNHNAPDGPQFVDIDSDPQPRKRRKWQLHLLHPGGVLRGQDNLCFQRHIAQLSPREPHCQAALFSQTLQQRPHRP